MQKTMRKHLEPGGLNDKDALSEIYGELDAEGFNVAVERLERPN
jgi:hypothetical protein